MSDLFKRGSEWRKWDLHVQTIYDQNYIGLDQYYNEIKSRLPDQWAQFVAKMGSESNALLHDLKAYFNDSRIPETERVSNYVINFLSYLSIFKPELKCIGLTDHNYFHASLLDCFIKKSEEFNCKIIGGVEINVGGIHVLAFFGNKLYGKASFSEGVITFLHKIGINNRMSGSSLTVTQKSITEVVKEIVNNSGIPVFPHCNSENGLFQERQRTDRVNLADIFNFQKTTLLQTASIEACKKIEGYIKSNANLKSGYCITLGSDSRCLKDVGSVDPNGNHFWVKANPTFLGLQHLQIEPDDRKYLGDLPNKIAIVTKNKTKYIESISIRKVASPILDDNWFDNINLPLNHDLVAIIGKKGSGKSALADILALVGKSKNRGFSFLNKQKFRRHDSILAKHFYATLSWESNNTDSRELDKDWDESEEQKVAYIPQSHFEKLCNEEVERAKEGTGESTEFEAELKKVIFSHVDKADKKSYDTLDEMIQNQCLAIDKKIDQHISDLNEINEKIISLEGKKSNDYIKTVESKLKIKNEELKSHLDGKPKEEKPPAESNTTQAKQKEISSLIEAKKKECEGTIALKNQKDGERHKIKTKIRSCGNISNSLDLLRIQLDKLNDELKKDLENLGLVHDDVLTFKIDTKKIETEKSKLTVELDRLDIELREQLGDGTPDPNGIPYKISAIEKEILNLSAQLDEPLRRYQAYVKSLKDWEDKKKNLEGDLTQPDSIKCLEDHLKYIREDLLHDLGNTRDQRLEITMSIYDFLKAKVEVYKELYKPIDDFIESRLTSKESQQLKFSVNMKDSGLIKWFFEYVDQHLKGSFIGQGYKVLAPLIEATNFDDKNETINFLKKIIDYLDYDYRVADGGEKEEREIASQIKKSRSSQIIEFYNGLFSLGFLSPTYSLSFEGKDIQQLSPGEKGAILLIFYLMVDKEEIPLIIDQPEENLDNESIYEMLVPIIREAKTKRQIIIVTHNPNLAVVCNAEQIIRATIDKTNKNRVKYDSGAIEDTNINQHIIDVLEGTMPAFRNRDDKYIEFQPS